MSRCDLALRRYAAAAALALLVLGIVSASSARAVGNGSAPNSLTKQYPLGTQTLCCSAGSGSTGPPATTSTARRSPPSATTGAATAPAPRRTASPARGHGGVPILLVAVIAGLLVVLAVVAFGFRNVLSSRRPRLQDRSTTPATARAPSMDVPRAQVRRVTTEPDQAQQAPIDGEPGDGVGDRQGTPLIMHRAGGSASADLEEASSPSDVESGDVAFELGVMLYERGHLDPAEAAWRRAVERRHARAATRLGMALERRGDVDGASKAYRDAERWGDAVGSERATALRRPDQPQSVPRPAQAPVSE